jgi:hypothetical protein
MKEESEKAEVVIEQKESLKLMKMSKGYQWEIKTLDMDLDRLKKINDTLVEQYGA